MVEDMKALWKNSTWEMVKLPKDKKAIGLNLDWPLRQLDVKNVFLYGDLLEEVYMDHPPGFTPKRGNSLQIEEGFIWIGAITKCMV
ncbi:retrotransposon protein putative unclassified expressed [Trifolium medium]|uniref:Retrotransposon protein putative unclassified expressed n=1 Tax=Trifolium medium TaxID=97028 RepID=A0A392MBV4_9FABA|nr:retrotransposon protein putative unclassified expressed [Trifolium medium]